jgi:hypothetical protein
LSVPSAALKERVLKLLSEHSQNEQVLDAYWQWATNPTPPSAGYALVENAGFIATNLMIRYGKPAVDVVTRLGEECEELQGEGSVYDLQQTILEVLQGPAGQTLRDGVLRRLNDPAPARRLLAAWLVSRARWGLRLGRDVHICGIFDWSLGADLEASDKDVDTAVCRALLAPAAVKVDLLREALHVGVANRLLYRSPSGRLEPKVRPGPRIPLAQIIYQAPT